MAHQAYLSMVKHLLADDAWNDCWHMQLAGLAGAWWFSSRMIGGAEGASRSENTSLFPNVSLVHQNVRDDVGGIYHDSCPFALSLRAG